MLHLYKLIKRSVLFISIRFKLKLETFQTFVINVIFKVNIHKHKYHSWYNMSNYNMFFVIELNHFNYQINYV